MQSSEGIDPVCETPISFGCVGNVEKCSPIFSVSEIGDYCRGQYSRLSDGDRDTVSENYCYRHPNVNECKCIMRSSNEDYKKLKIGNPFSDSCWYIPCSNRFQYFVPSAFDVITKCPQNICQIVYDISKVHGVDLNNIKNDINCDFSNGGVIPDPTSLPNWVYIASLLIITAFIFVYSIKK